MANGQTAAAKLPNWCVRLMDQKKYKKFKQNSLESSLHENVCHANTSTLMYSILDLDPQVLTTIGDLYIFSKLLRFVQRLGK